MTCSTMLQRWLKDESGATAIEYTLISGAMAVAIVPAIGMIANGTDGIYGYIADLFGLV